MIDYRVYIARTMDEEGSEEVIELSASSLADVAVQGLKAVGGGSAECAEVYTFGYRVAQFLYCTIADGQLEYDVRSP